MQPLKAPGTLLFLAVTHLGPASEPVGIPDFRSPNGAFTIRLTRDRTEDEQLPDAAPDVQIITTASNKVLANFLFVGDPNSDLRPFSSRITANWNDVGSNVALTFSERFYTHLLVYCLQGTTEKPASFVEVVLPNTGAVIQAMVPRFKEFRSRWHHHFQDWPNVNTIQFSAGTDAIIESVDDAGAAFWAVYSFTVDISNPKTPVVQRVERVKAEEQ